MVHKLYILRVVGSSATTVATVDQYINQSIPLTFSAITQPRRDNFLSWPQADEHEFGTIVDWES